MISTMRRPRSNYRLAQTMNYSNRRSRHPSARLSGISIVHEACSNRHLDGHVSFVVLVVLFIAAGEFLAELDFFRHGFLAAALVILIHRTAQFTVLNGRCATFLAFGSFGFGSARSISGFGGGRIRSDGVCLVTNRCQTADLGDTVCDGLWRNACIVR